MRTRGVSLKSGRRLTLARPRAGILKDRVAGMVVSSATSSPPAKPWTIVAPACGSDRVSCKQRLQDEDLRAEASNAPGKGSRCCQSMK